MSKVETIEDFYKRKFDWMPENLKNEIGHFNIFNLAPFVGEKAKPVPYKRRDYFKVMLVTGKSQVHYADRIEQVEKQALSFSNPQIPYKWEHLSDEVAGVYCVFDQHFFHQFGQLSQYAVFEPNGKHIFELNNEQVGEVELIFKKMVSELNSNYKHKFDLLRNLVFELIHFASKLNPENVFDKQPINAAQRISTLFLELLERQFPIDDNFQKINLRTASEFAEKLNIHVNHLNKALKETMQKTTTQLIGDRILQEGKILLKHSSWNVSEISDALGFNEVTHFNYFFKKETGMNPLKFRNT